MQVRLESWQDSKYYLILLAGTETIHFQKHSGDVIHYASWFWHRLKNECLECAARKLELWS